MIRRAFLKLSTVEASSGDLLTPPCVHPKKELLCSYSSLFSTCLRCVVGSLGCHSVSRWKIQPVRQPCHPSSWRVRQPLLDHFRNRISFTRFLLPVPSSRAAPRRAGSAGVFSQIRAKTTVEEKWNCHATGSVVGSEKIDGNQLDPTSGNFSPPCFVTCRGNVRDLFPLNINYPYSIVFCFFEGSFSAE